MGQGLEGHPDWMTPRRPINHVRSSLIPGFECVCVTVCLHG